MQINPNSIAWDDAPVPMRQPTMIAPPKPEKPEKPTVVKYESGDEIVTEQVGPDGRRTPIARAPRQMPQRVGPSADAVNQARTRYNQATLFRKQLQEVNRLWKQTQKGGGLGGIMEYFPTPANKQFDKAASGLKALARTLFKTPGDQMTEFEGRPIVEMIPDRWSFDEANVQAINQLDQLAREIIAQNAPVVGKKVSYRQPSRNRPAKKRVIDFNDLPE